MASQEQLAVLSRLFSEAEKSGCIFPDGQACEGVVETCWGESQGYLQGNNVFGCKQHVHPIYGTVRLPTREYLGGAWVVEEDAFIEYPSIEAAFADRQMTLEALAPHYPHYASALAANTAEVFLTQVSQSWSTDPNRAQTCIGILHAHADVFVLGGGSV